MRKKGKRIRYNNVFVLILLIYSIETHVSKEAFLFVTHCSVCRLDLLPHISFQRSCASVKNVKLFGYPTVDVIYNLITI